jgi:hypothetical protein
MSEEPVAKRQKVGHMLNIADCVDKASEGLPFSVLKVSKLSVLQGLAEHADDMMTAFGLYTVEEFAAWRFGRWAQALVTMADCEVEGKRPLDAKLNIDLALDKEHETKSLKEIIQLSPSALQGLPPAADEILQSHQVTTIEKLGSWKYLKWAQAIVTLADAEELETDAEKNLSNPYVAIVASLEASVRAALFSQVADASRKANNLNDIAALVDPPKGVPQKMSGRWRRDLVLAVQRAQNMAKPRGRPSTDSQVDADNSSSSSGLQFELQLQAQARQHAQEQALAEKQSNALAAAVAEIRAQGEAQARQHAQERALAEEQRNALAAAVAEIRAQGEAFRQAQAQALAQAQFQAQQARAWRRTLQSGRVLQAQIRYYFTVARTHERNLIRSERLLRNQAQAWARAQAQWELLFAVLMDRLARRRPGR